MPDDLTGVIAPVKIEDAFVSDQHDATIVVMHEGAKLKAIIDREGLKAKEFAAAAGIEPGSLSRYFRQDQLAEEPWAHVVQAFMKLKWEVKELRPSATALRAKSVDLFPLVENWKLEQLETLRTILEEEDQGAREKLLSNLKVALKFGRR